MRKSYKVIILLLSIISVAFVLYFYSTPLLMQLGRWQVARECRRAFGAPMSHSGVEIADGTITIHHPCFTHTVDENQGWNLSAEALSIQGNFFPWQQKRPLELSLLRPTMNIYTEAGGKPVMDWFQFGDEGQQGQWQLEQGAINLYSATNDEVIHFAIEGKGELGGTNQLTLHLQRDEQPEGKLTLSYHNFEQSAVLAFTVDALDGATCLETLQRLDPTLAPDWRIDHGLIQGKGALCLNSDSLPSMRGKLEIQDIVFRHLPSQAKGWIPLTQFHLEPEHGLIKERPADLSRENFLTQLALGTRGRLELPEPGYLTVEPEHSSAWTLRNMKGSITLDASDLSLDLQSVLGYGHKSCFFHASGHLAVSEPLSADFALSWIPASATIPASTSKLLLHETPAGDEVITLDLVNIGTEQAVMLHAIASDLFPEMAGAHLSNGKLSGLIDLVIHEGYIRELAVKDLAADHLAFSIPHWQVEGKLARATGSFSAEVSEAGRIHHISSDLALAGGGVQFQDTEGTQQLLSDLEIDLHMRQGELENIHLATTLDGLKGTISSQGLKSGEGVLIRLQGTMEALGNKLPPGVQSVLFRSFRDDSLDLEATVRVEDPFFSIEGACSVMGADEASDRLPFAVRMRHVEAGPSHPPSGLGVWLELAMSLAEAHLSDPIGRVVVEDGWIRGRDLEASKYALPLIRKPIPTRLSGTLDFDARLANDLLTVEYEGCNVELECRAFSISVPHLGNLAENAPDAQRAFHYINIITGEERGTIPVDRGHLLEHHTGLEFQECSGSVLLQPNQVQITDIQTHCEGLDATGCVIVDDLDEVATDVTIVADTMHGPLLGAQQLLAHVTASPLLDLPLEGEAAIEKEGFHLVLHMGQEIPNEASVKATIQEGTWQPGEGQPALTEMTGRVTYDHHQHELLIEGLQGKYGCGEAAFTVVSDSLALSDFPNGPASFDIALFADTDEMARCKGAFAAADPGGLRTVHLDLAQSHIGSLQARSLECQVRDWIHPVSFQLDTSVELEEIPDALLFLQQMGLASGANGIVAQSLGNHPSGTLHTMVNFEKSRDVHTGEESEDLWSIKAVGQNVTLHEKDIQTFRASGKGSGTRWTVDELLLDDWIAQFALHRTSGGWEFPFFHAAYAETAAIELNGKIDEQTQTFVGTLRTAAIELDHNRALPLQKIPLLERLCKQMDASGRLVAHGSIHLQPDPAASSGWALTLDGEAFLDQAQIGGIFVQLHKGVHFTLSPNGQLMVQGMDAALVPSYPSLDENHTGSYKSVSTKLTQAVCHLDSGNWNVEALEFSAPREHLPWIAKSLRSMRSSGQNQNAPAPSLHALHRLEPNDNLAGKLSLMSEEGALHFVLHLDDGVYQLGDQRLTLQNIVLRSQEGGTKIEAQTVLNGETLWIETTYNPRTTQLSDLIISDCPIKPGIAPMKISLTQGLNQNGAIEIERICGTLHGLALDLRRQPTSPDQNATVYSGVIHLLHPNALALLPQGLRTSLQTAGIGGGYHFSGRFILPQGRLSQLNVNGTLTGQHFVAKGYQLRSLTAQAQMTPNTLLLRSVFIQDPAGQIQVDRLFGHKQANGAWLFEIPSIKMRNVQPGLLHAPGQPPPQKKPLIITYAEIAHLQGVQGKPESWTGKGNMQFSRTLPSRARLQIPDELRNRQNLNSGRLTPAQGTVQFSIHHRGFYIDKLQNTYSEGKQTQFYLAKGQGPSYIDFNGQLHLKMRVKQRNLFLKLTEPFTIHVKGSLDKPRWSLRATKKAS